MKNIDERNNMVKNISIVVLLICSIQNFGQQSIKETVADYFKEIKTATAENKNLWSYDLYAPILFVQPDTRELYANYPDTAGALKKEGTIFTGILPKEINIANTAIDWNGIRWAILMLPLPENKNDRINFLAHELFHRVQPHLGFKLYNPDNNHLDQKEGRIFLRLELEALKTAVATLSVKDMKRQLTNAFIFRQQRYKTFPGADSTENLLELNEGLAEYTGVLMSGRNDEEMKSHFMESINKFLKNPTFVRSFAYQTTPIYGYLLRKIKPEWNKEITMGTNLTKYFQNRFEISSFKDLENIIPRIGDQYGGEKIISEEIKREQEINNRILGYKKIFIEQSHLEIHFQNMNISFDPRNIMPLEDKGTVYPNIRVTDNWGILTVTNGALMSPNWDKISVSIPTQISEEKVAGDGWMLELKNGFIVQRDSTSGNYILKKK